MIKRARINCARGTNRYEYDRNVDGAQVCGWVLPMTNSNVFTSFVTHITGIEGRTETTKKL